MVKRGKWCIGIGLAVMLLVFSTAAVGAAEVTAEAAVQNIISDQSAQFAGEGTLGFVYEGSEPLKVTVSNLGDSVLYYRLRYPFDMCLLGSEAGSNVLRPGESRTYSRLEVAIHGESAQGYYRTVIYSVDGSAGHFGLEVERVMD